mgnify:CR=1 FL=1
MLWEGYASFPTVRGRDLEWLTANPTIKEIEKECRKVAHSRWEETQSQVQALIPEKFQETQQEKNENLKLIADLKSHFKSRAPEPPKRERPTITDAEVLKGLDRLAQEWDKSRG